MRLVSTSVLAMTVVSGATLFATVTDPLTLRQLAVTSTLIVRGSVTDVRAMTVPNRGIESVATIAVERVIKGESEPFISVRVPGGVVGGYRRITIGAPVFRLNQQAVFFLKRGVDNGWRPVGMSAGVVRVLSETETGRRLIAPAVVRGQTASAGPIVRGDNRRRSLSVEEFEALVALVMIDAPVTGEVAP